MQEAEDLLADAIAQPRIGARLKWWLRNENIYSVDDLLKRTEEEVIRAPNMGRATLGLLKSELAKFGFVLGRPTLDTSDGFKKAPPDQECEQAIAKHCEAFAIDPLTAVKLFPVLARRQWLKRFLAHVELFKLTLDVPGDIAELGVYRGAGLFTWANLLEAYCIGDRTKVVYGFDDWLGRAGFTGASESEVRDAIKIFDNDRFVPWKQRIKVKVGDICKTVTELSDGVRFSLIHFDCDLLDPTRAALDALWPRLSRGGVAIFDEYGQPDWPGETQAVDEFLIEHRRLRLMTFHWTNTPGAYLVKP